jgi:hypothetical protein
MALVLVSAGDGSDVWMDEESGRTIQATQDQSAAVQKGTSMDDWIAIGKGVLNTVQTAQLNQINVDRAKMGLQPIDVTRYTGMGVNVGLSPQTQQLVMYGGLALLAVMLINSFTRK